MLGKPHILSLFPNSFNRFSYLYIWVLTRKTLSSEFANNKGADQPEHLPSLISAFVVCLLGCIISKLLSNKISSF